ncbi:hypothetical protein [Brachybacterium sp. AOP29-B2-41]|uniref:hypothetical protein n=1 Tax=Brachybacterium sp. AOP29-B2-41 TaxID=3457704 RepID=UPI0040344E32
MHDNPALRGHLQAVKADRPYKAALLWATVLIHCDTETLAWCPPSCVELRRALATGEEEKAKNVDVEAAIRQCISMGILTRDSSQERLELSR